MRRYVRFDLWKSVGYKEKYDAVCLFVLSEYGHEIPWTLSFKSRDSPPCNVFYVVFYDLT